jgi:hypothetical protein
LKHNETSTLGANMLGSLRVIIFTSLLLMVSFASSGQEVSREQIKGLDEQIQEIKSDILGIAAELNQLEEKLLYPSDTQISVFVSLAKGEKFRLDGVEIQLGGKPVVHHLYTFKELEALQKGGVQRIYTGNIRTGGHDLQVTFTGKSEGGADMRKTESFRIEKGVGPRIVELTLAASRVAIKDR